eukprot:scaffold24925_cov79-Isochrysis_galbana.AAC.1
MLQARAPRVRLIFSRGLKARTSAITCAAHPASAAAPSARPACFVSRAAAATVFRYRPCGAPSAAAAAADEAAGRMISRGGPAAAAAQWRKEEGAAEEVEGARA